MVTYHPDILPFNIAVAHVDEFDKLTDWTDDTGHPLTKDAPALMKGVEIKAYRHDKKYGKICYALIAFPKKPTQETIAHEAFHAACDLLQHVGIHYARFDNNEIYAYTMEYIVGCVNDALQKDKVWKDEPDEKRG